MFDHYYHGMLRKYTIGFGSLFGGIKVVRYDTSGQPIKTIDVPIGYSPKQKWLARLNEDPDLDKPVAITLPRIGFEITGLTYDAEGNLNKLRRNRSESSLPGDANTFLSQYVPVHYNLEMDMSIFSKNADDAAQIIEQIIPYFQPSYTISINSIPELNIVDDVPITLNSIAIEDTYEGDYETRKVLIYNLSFGIKARFYGPVSNTGIINKSIANVKDNTPATTPTIERLTTTEAIDGFDTDIEQGPL